MYNFLKFSTRRGCFSGGLSFVRCSAPLACCCLSPNQLLVNSPIKIHTPILPTKPLAPSLSCCWLVAVPVPTPKSQVPTQPCLQKTASRQNLQQSSPEQTRKRLQWREGDSSRRRAGRVRDYSGGVTFSVAVTGLMAASCGLIFGYDIGVSGAACIHMPPLRTAPQPRHGSSVSKLFLLAICMRNLSSPSPPNNFPNKSHQL